MESKYEVKVTIFEIFKYDITIKNSYVNQKKKRLAVHMYDLMGPLGFIILSIPTLTCVSK